MGKIIRWAVCGLGGISHTFMRAAQKSDGMKVVACVSSSKARALEFQAKYGLESAYTYGEFLKAKDIDAVYVGTDMNRHCENTVAFLKAGFSVLCEKSFACTLAETEKMIAAAHESGKLLMEAMWTRFIPCTQKLLEVVRSGRFGKILEMKGDMIGFFPNKNHRVFDYKRGGGSIFDLMVYNVAYATFLAGVSKKVEVEGTTENGVDRECSLTLSYPDGAVARLKSATTRKKIRFGFTILCEKGVIRIPHFHWGMGFKIKETGKLFAERYRFRHPDFTYEIAHFNGLLREGKTESPLVSFAHTTEVMRILDEANRALGVVF
ncbi:MAG: Gfo/Idh/MocA family oxidoreductase [Clostridiales bacterium]|nr:Gfo/Idh/MocA family oxidoreductase [Clostridiales bacterium]